DSAPLDQRLDLRSEVERAVFLHDVIQRLDAEPVARERQPAPAAVPDSIGEHPAQLLDSAQPEFLVDMDDPLGVGRTAITMAALFQHRAQLAVVVYFAVECDPDRAVLVRHWLIASSRIDYGQSAVPQARRTVYQDACPIRPAMNERIAHHYQL